MHSYYDKLLWKLNIQQPCCGGKYKSNFQLFPIQLESWKSNNFMVKLRLSGKAVTVKRIVSNILTNIVKV